MGIKLLLLVNPIVLDAAWMNREAYTCYHARFHVANLQFDELWQKKADEPSGLTTSFHVFLSSFNQTMLHSPNITLKTQSDTASSNDPSSTPTQLPALFLIQ